MKVLVVGVVLFFLGVNGQAKQTTVGGHLGFDQGAPILGIDFDYRTKKSTALHGYLLYGMESEFLSSIGRDETQKIAFGAGMKIFFGPKRWSLSLTPGLGVTLLTLKQFLVTNGTQVANVSDTLFGPILKFDASYRFSKKLSVGLSHTMQSNWFSSNASGLLSFTTVTGRLKF